MPAFQLSLVEAIPGGDSSSHESNGTGVAMLPSPIHYKPSSFIKVLSDAAVVCLGHFFPDISHSQAHPQDHDDHCSVLKVPGTGTGTCRSLVSSFLDNSTRPTLSSFMKFFSDAAVVSGLGNFFPDISHHQVHPQGHDDHLHAFDDSSTHHFHATSFGAPSEQLLNELDNIKRWSLEKGTWNGKTGVEATYFATKRDEWTAKKLEKQIDEFKKSHESSGYSSPAASSDEFKKSGGDKNG